MSKVRPFLRLLLLSVATLTCVAALSQPVSDISVSKTGPSVAAANTDVSYDVTVTNLGPDDSDTITLTDNIPPGMTFVSRNQNSGPTFSCSDPGVGNNGPVVCTIASLPVNATADFTFVFHIAPGTPPGTFFTNQATSSCPSDPSSENDTGTAVTSTPSNAADVGITKTGPSSAAENSDVAYTITVINAGPATATSVQFTDTLPAPMTFVSLNQNSGPTFSCSGTSTVVCSIASLASGATATFTLTGHIPAGTQPGTTFQNTTTVESDSDPTPENDSSTTTLTVSSADLAAVKSAPPTVIAGNNLSYALTLTNNGPDAAINARIDDFFSPQTTFVSLVQNTGPSASCGQTNTNTAGCSLAGLSNGASATFTLTVFVPATVVDGTVLTNTATASSDAADTNSNNNSSTANTTVIGVTDLGVVKTASATATAGGNINYSITVTNSGASPAVAAQLSDTLPANTSFVSINQNTGPAAACSGTTTVTCNWASFAPGATATFSMVVKVAAGAPSGIISNTATVTTSTGDTNPANNSSTANTSVGVSSDVSVTKNGPPTGVQGQNVTYTIVVANSGPSNATTVTLTDAIPAGSTFVSLNQSGPVFSCTQPPAGGTGTVNCSIATLVSGGSTTFTLVVQAGATTTALSNTANVTSVSADPNPANNTATTNATIIPLGQVPALSPLLLAMLGAALAAAALMARR